MSFMKKAAIYLGLLLLIVAGTLYYLGSKPVKAKGAVSVAAPPDVIFKLLSDPDWYQKCDESIDGIEVVQGERIGTLDNSDDEDEETIDVAPEVETCIWEVSYDGEAGRFQVTERAAEVERNQRLLLKTRAEKWKGSADFQLEWKEDGTTKLMLSQHQRAVSFYPLFAIFDAPDLKETVDRRLDKIKRLAQNAYDGGELTTDPTTYETAAEKQERIEDEKRLKEQEDDETTKLSPMVPPIPTQEQLDDLAVESESSATPSPEDSIDDDSSREPTGE